MNKSMDYGLMDRQKDEVQKVESAKCKIHTTHTRIIQMMYITYIICMHAQ